MTDPFSKDPGCLIFGEELDDKDFQILLSIVNLEKNNRSTRTISFLKKIYSSLFIHPFRV
jgi:hypothetical protein